MYQEVLEFWFKEIEPAQRFAKDEAFDQLIRERFGNVHQQATQGECQAWRQTISGRLAEIIVLDQFSRNLYRDNPQAFAYDGMALVLTQEALKLEELSDLTVAERGFLLMPLMHSESLLMHEEARRRFAEPGLENQLKYEQQHHAIIQRFGRYPHRNEVLGRKSTTAEKVFLTEPGSSF